MREDNVLPAVTGRVCPQEDQCEGACVMGKKFDPLAIGYLERFIADWEARLGRARPAAARPGHRQEGRLRRQRPRRRSPPPATSSRRATTSPSSRPCTRSAACSSTASPSSACPKDIVRREVENMEKMGVRFETNVVVGRTVTIDELMKEEGYDAVFVATGAGLPKFLDVPGENLNGVYSANEFLSRVNLMKAYRFPEYDEPIYDCRGKNVAVVGGGNTAMDADPHRAAPRRREGDDALPPLRGRDARPRRGDPPRQGRGRRDPHPHPPGRVPRRRAGAGCAPRAASGWRSASPTTRAAAGPCPIEGSEFEIPLDVAIVAVGTGPNPLVQSTTPDLATNRKGYIAVADPETLRTSKKGVFAGGDIVTGAATVILAMGAGRKAARSIHEYLTTGSW